MYFVYKLLDYKQKVFYVGITKNIHIRIEEHTRCKSSHPAKNYRVRRCILEHGRLLYELYKVETLDEARKLEKQYIDYFKHQLVNKQHGKLNNTKGRIRKQGRSVQCPNCKNWFRRINNHICVKEP